MRILIADDHPLYREAIQAQVERIFPGAETVMAGSTDEALQRLRATPPVDLAIIDLIMPGGSDANGVRRAVEAAGTAPVAVVSGQVDPRGARACIAAGAKAYVPKTLDPAVFASALTIVAAGGTYVPAEFLGGDEPAPRPASSDGDLLSAREFAILRMVVDGRSNKEIARSLGVQEVTVKVNLTRIFARLGARNRAQAAAIAVEMKLMPHPV